MDRFKLSLRSALLVAPFVLSIGSLLSTGSALGRDDGRYADSPLKPWFDSLRSHLGPCCSDADGFAMRRRLNNFLPIVLIALLVQIFAPIGACWAASIAASDPLAGVTSLWIHSW